MKSIGVDLTNIEITINCSPEQFMSQVTASALRLLCNKLLAWYFSIKSKIQEIAPNPLTDNRPIGPDDPAV